MVHAVTGIFPTFPPSAEDIPVPSLTGRGALPRLRGRKRRISIAQQRREHAQLIPLIAIVVMFAWASPASAIIGGSPDGESHPYVGMTFNDEFVCSGTLISPTVFLTAGHCADFLKVPSQGQGWVTFQENGQSFPEDVPIADAYTYPGFCNDDGFTVPVFSPVRCSGSPSTTSASWCWRRRCS